MNSRAGLNPTYTLSRGASSANLSTSPNFIFYMIYLLRNAKIQTSVEDILSQNLYFVKPIPKFYFTTFLSFLSE